MLVASDFDGTLSPIVANPAGAELHSGAPEVLRDLGSLFPRIRLAILSGRALDDLALRLGTAAHNSILAGNHGLEIREQGLDWIHPDVNAGRPYLDAIAVQLRGIVGAIHGLEIEDKGASITLHYRRMDESCFPRLVSLIGSAEVPPEIRIHEGKKVFEFRPKIPWNKGFALREISRHLDVPDNAIVFLGDDLTDEDAFRELREGAITVHVGSPVGISMARFNANDPSDAVQFLREMYQLLKGQSTAVTRESPAGNNDRL